MKSILIAYSKGGCVKTTLATNLAGYFAAIGACAILSDLDRQQSSSRWLKLRPVVLSSIHNQIPRIKALSVDADWIITDHPAGFHDKKLRVALKQNDCMNVPIQPSASDMGATSDFLDLPAEEKDIRKNKKFWFWLA